MSERWEWRTVGSESACAAPPASSGRADAPSDAETALRFATGLRTLLASPLDPTALLRAVARSALPALGDLCMVDVEDPGAGWQRVLVSVIPPRDEASLGAHLAAHLPSVVACHPVLQSGEPLVLAADDGVVTSALAVPMRMGAAMVGVMTFATVAPSVRRLESHDVPLALELASQAACALEHVRLADARRHDLAARREAEAALDGFFAAPGVAMAVMTLDDSTRDVVVTRPNAAYAALYGLTPARLAGRGLREVTGDAAHVQARYALADACRRTGEPLVQEVTVDLPIGTRTKLLSLHRIGPRADGASIACVAIDMTAQKQLEAEFLQAQKTATVGQLAGGIAHDFNNALTVIAAAAEVVLDGRDGAAQRGTDLLEVRRAIDRAAELNRQLLALSRRQHFERRPLSLNDVTREVSPMLRRLLRADVAIDYELAEELPPVLADRGQVGQVLFNLVLNARDAMPDGGQLTITSRCVPVGGLPRGLRVARAGSQADAASVGQPTHFCLLAVADTGIGIPEEVRARIFEPFFTTKGPEHGAGLGLSTVRRILTASGGEVWVESAPNAGATVTVAFPCLMTPEASRDAAETLVECAAPVDTRAESAKGSPPAAAMARPLAAGGVETLLLVEDDTTVRLFAARALRAKGYRVLEAASQEEALAVVEAHDSPIDLLITDMELPDGTGPMVLDQVARVGAARARRLPVVYVSGHASPAHGDQRPDVVAAPFVPKPFTSERLAHVVRAELAAAAASVEGHVLSSRNER